ncbi:MAG: ATP-dependent Clp protease ATP-binding subunit, partial [Candidatus Berkelbacteria bacterium]|nr:ATP-dependent Clp protease ATP-binding subunit [Candidatus Berkelbacteria bacterium]
MIGNLFNKRRFSDGQSQPGSTPVQQPVMATADNVSQGSNVIGSSMMPEKRQDFTVLTHLDTRMTLVLNHAEQEARRIRQQFIEPEQLLLGLLFDQDIFKLFGEFSVDTVRLSHELQEKADSGNFQDQPRLSDASKKIIEESYKSAKTRGVEFITPEDLLLSLFSSATAVSDFLKTKGLEKEKIEEKLSKSANFAIGKKSVLGKYGIDLTDQARRETLDPVVGRDKEVERLIHILLRRTKNNPLVIGDAGVGKTAIIEGLAQNIVKGTAPKDLLQKRIIQLDLASLVAGAAHRGEFEERLRDVIKETQASSGQIILFIDEIHNLIGAGGSEGTMDASNIVKPYLARGQLQIIGTTTVSEFRKYFEKDKAFERRFQPILVEEPTEEVAIEMLNVLKPKYENYHKVVITDDAVKSAVHLSKKYIGERFLPDKAVDLLDEASAEVKLKYSEEKRKDNNVTAEDIENVVSAWTGIPITKLTEDEGQKLLHLEELVHKRLINQEVAVAAVSEAVRRGRIGLASANRPIASFIFLGPTGVGKTELAKVLAEILFGRDDAMIRLDMSEYMEKHEVAKLIGAPPGYVGYEEGGQLTEAVRLKPYSIVLLDEVEK